MTDKLILEKIDNTAKITINNPSANTWDLESLSGLEEIIELLNKDDEVFSLVITGQGEKFFSAGADLKVFHEGGKDAAKEMSNACLLYTSPSPRDQRGSRMPSSA